MLSGVGEQITEEKEGRDEREKWEGEEKKEWRKKRREGGRRGSVKEKRPGSNIQAGAQGRVLLGFFGVE